jgi:hypothetical protein
MHFDLSLENIVLTKLVEKSQNMLRMCEQGEKEH